MQNQRLNVRKTIAKGEHPLRKALGTIQLHVENSERGKPQAGKLPILRMRRGNNFVPTQRQNL